MTNYSKKNYLRSSVLTILLLLGLTSAYSQVYEPTYHVTGFTVGTVTSTSIQINWTGSVGAKSRNARIRAGGLLCVRVMRSRHDVVKTRDFRQGYWSW